MRSSARLRIGSVLLSAILSCHNRATTWRDSASASGCTAELLAHSPRYDSSDVRALVGVYRLVQVDTAAGWHELEAYLRERIMRDTSRRNTQVASNALRLWSTDSVPARTWPDSNGGTLIHVRTPVAGALGRSSGAGFPADYPQVEATSAGLDYLEVRVTRQTVLDGPGGSAPIQRLGPWGFGGDLVERSLILAEGLDGRPLGQRAGFYCALRPGAGVPD